MAWRGVQRAHEIQSERACFSLTFVKFYNYQYKSNLNNNYNTTSTSTTTINNNNRAQIYSSHEKTGNNHDYLSGHRTILKMWNKGEPFLD